MKNPFQNRVSRAETVQSCHVSVSRNFLSSSERESSSPNFVDIAETRLSNFQFQTTGIARGSARLCAKYCERAISPSRDRFKTSRRRTRAPRFVVANVGSLLFGPGAESPRSLDFSKRKGKFTRTKLAFVPSSLLTRGYTLHLRNARYRVLVLGETRARKRARSNAVSNTFTHFWSIRKLIAAKSRARSTHGTSITRIDGTGNPRVDFPDFREVSRENVEGSHALAR